MVGLSTLGSVPRTKDIGQDLELRAHVDLTVLSIFQKTVTF